jgi:hypothetical protein
VRQSEKRSHQRRPVTPLGLLPPRYSFVLHPDIRDRFTRCPRCNAHTRLRKLPPVIHVEHPAGARLTILGKTCRLCIVCEMLIAHAADITHLLVASGVAAEGEAPDYVVLGPSHHVCGAQASHPASRWRRCGHPWPIFRHVARATFAMSRLRMPATCFHGISGRRDLQPSVKMLDGLADHFELADRRVLPHSIGEERVATRLGVLDDVVDRVANVFQADAVVLHRADASARMRC